ncbi:BgTH12-06022 [Blumeria graminis f. sp. triticale]|uniref:non-specific serine/threonine protein kinase n=1 Tax=Blumeria graminis f. sp. triticale TaxID=1689686 RepID=A0A9W4D572_BLUGR|nr:BgTH12-06022 [Blumeria graminis f. sp. triticale]
MDWHQTRSVESNPIKTKAAEDARQMQAKVIEQCQKSGKDPPPYGLEELIGKGSFGRVYKGKDMRSAAVVAIKIIDIDESDTQNPRNADAYSDVLKEIGALSILRETKAKNINHVIEALVIGQSVWMITEHCVGGSVATLMKPTYPAGLQEKWIIPIVREVAEALRYVHAAGIIHRDIKCANVLITEQGGVQLCDFGVAGVIDSKFDKRSTIIGTPHWMAPELLSGSASYGKEVDIWAFGSMVYEIATGLPPNVANGIPYDRLGTHLKHHAPRLKAGDYSHELCNLVSYCLEEEPSARPSIEDVQKHSYILDTELSYPTCSLRALVGSFKVWESRGGSRKSLFMQHGAQGHASTNPSANYEWNFSTTEFFDKEVLDEFSARDVYDAYGSAVLDFDEDTAKPQRVSRPSRRRAPPEALSRMPAQPLEKIFDPNTLSNYDDNSRAQYGGAMVRLNSDLPLRDNSAQPPIRDTMIDLDDHDIGASHSSYSDMATIKASRQASNEDEISSLSGASGQSPMEDLTEGKKNRRTQDWKFPTMPAVSEAYRSPQDFEAEDLIDPRPSLVHHTTEPVSMFGGAMRSPASATDRMSIQSLIDLDMSLPEPIRGSPRPSTGLSETGSITSEPAAIINPFEFERHPSVYHSSREREPSIYVDEDKISSSHAQILGLSDSNDYSDTERTQTNYSQFDDVPDEDQASTSPPILHPPIMPIHPSEKSLMGTATADEMKSEFSRILQGMIQQLDAFCDSYDAAKLLTTKIDELVDQGNELQRRNFTE